MKTIKTLALLATLTSGWLATAVAQPVPAPAPETKPPAQTDSRFGEPQALACRLDLAVVITHEFKVG